MISFIILLRNMWHIIKILFKQEEQKALMIAVCFLLALGTVFYHNIESMSYLDALYFSVVTLATIGYGDLYPVTTLGKLFSILYVFLGVGLLGAMIANCNRAFAEYHRQKRENSGKESVKKE